MKISRRFTFEAMHTLPRHPGKCSRPHGHSYVLIVTVSGPVLDESQFVMDYGDLKRAVQPIVDAFDHQNLNCFIKYPSAENIATHIAWLIKPRLSSVDSLRVEVHETENTTAVWDSTNLEDEARLLDMMGGVTGLGKVLPEWGPPVEETREILRGMPHEPETYNHFMEVAAEKARVAFAEYERQATILTQLDRAMRLSAL